MSTVGAKGLKYTMTAIGAEVEFNVPPDKMKQNKTTLSPLTTLSRETRRAYSTTLLSTHGACENTQQ